MTNKYGSFEFQVNIIKSSSIKNIDTEDWVDIVNKTQGNIRTIHEYYPRFHTKWGRIHCREGVGNVYFRKTKNTDIEKAESILVPICKPSGYTSNISNQLKYINELSYSIYDFSCKYAAVLPKETIQKANLFISRIGSRMGKNGLNVSFGKISTNSYRDSIYFSLPIATDIFGEWLKEKGWSYELSAPGRLSTELYNQIDGWFYAFERKDLLELLETMSKQSSHEGKGERIGTIDSKLKEVFKKDHIDYRKIFDLPVFATGLNLKCPKCGRFSWYSLTELSDGVTCKKCLSQFNSAKPIRSNKKNHWAYKIIGPLSVPGYADGAFSVISAINFFNQKFVGHMPMTATYSFETKNKTSGEKIEIDYAFLAGSDTFGNTFSDVVFGEAKSFNDFQKSDFAKMKLLMKSFPGAFIVFSTLKDKLTKQEIKELVKLTKIGNKYWENNRPINPLIVLTGNELLSPFGPPICWEKDAYKTTQERCGTLLELANATQRRYLGIGSWEEDWIKKFEAKRKKLDQE